MLNRAAATLAALLLASATLAGCGEDSDSTATDTSSPTAESTVEGPDCDYPAGAPAAKDVDAPPGQADVEGTVDVTMATSAGDIGLALDADAAPCTVTSFVSLAEQGYFDATTCHRLTTPQASIYVLQCGDPTGTGSGGPGYSFSDELTGKEKYPAGTVAMANAGPDTNGSQFFLVYEDTALPAAYTVFGQVDDAGLEVVRAIAAKGTTTGAPDGPPSEPVEIDSVSVD